MAPMHGLLLVRAVRGLCRRFQFSQIWLVVIQCDPMQSFDMVGVCFVVNICLFLQWFGLNLCLLYSLL